MGKTLIINATAKGAQKLRKRLSLKKRRQMSRRDLLKHIKSSPQAFKSRKDLMCSLGLTFYGKRRSKGITCEASLSVTDILTKISEWAKKPACA